VAEDIDINFGIAACGSGVARVAEVEAMPGLHRLANWRHWYQGWYMMRGDLGIV
jgi:chemotaxis signal transduction protein